MIEFILVVIGIVVIVYTFFNFSSLLILKNPKNNEITYNRYPEFEWSGSSDSYTITVSKNSNFENPIVNTTINISYYKINKKLDFGDYYWKVTENKNSNQRYRKFTIQSLIAIEYDEQGDIRNAGNTKISTKENIFATGAAILDVNQVLKRRLIGNITFEQNE